MSRSPNRVSASERGNRRRGEQQHVGRIALVHQRRALLDAEAVLLVDHDEAEPLEADLFLHQRVGADDQRRVALDEARTRGTLVRRAQPAEQQLRHEAEGRDQLR